MQRIYLDNAATTPLDPRVWKAMAPYRTQAWGDPSGLRLEGDQASEAVERARQQVADLLDAQPQEIVFTANGTEADNLALRGVFGMDRSAKGHLITSAVEHPAVLACCRQLQREGVAVTILPVSPEGIVEPDSLRRALRPETRLVSIMAANHVAGTLQPVEALGAIAHEHGVLMHTDAVQATGKIPLWMSRQPVDLLSLSAHKMHGPKGVGALYVRGGLRLRPNLENGNQDGKGQLSRENLAGVVGLGAAAEIARLEMSAEATRLAWLRDHLIDTALTAIPNAYLIGDRYRRLPGHTCLAFAGMEGEANRLLLELDQAGIAVSSGGTCSPGRAGEATYVLRAMGYDAYQSHGSLRISLGRMNTREDVERLLQILPRAVNRLRPMSRAIRSAIVPGFASAETVSSVG